MYKHVSSYLPLQVLLEVFPEMQPELSEDSREPQGYEEISGMNRWSNCMCVKVCLYFSAEENVVE